MPELNLWLRSQRFLIFVWTLCLMGTASQIFEKKNNSTACFLFFVICFSNLSITCRIFLHENHCISWFPWSNKTWTEVLHRFKSCLWHFGDLPWWEYLVMVQDENRVITAFRWSAILKQFSYNSTKIVHWPPFKIFHPLNFCFVTDGALKPRPIQFENEEPISMHKLNIALLKATTNLFPCRAKYCNARTTGM